MKALLCGSMHGLQCVYVHNAHIIAMLCLLSKVVAIFVPTAENAALKTILETFYEKCLSEIILVNLTCTVFKNKKTLSDILNRQSSKFGLHH